MPKNTDFRSARVVCSTVAVGTNKATPSLRCFCNAAASGLGRLQHNPVVLRRTIDSISSKVVCGLPITLGTLRLASHRRSLGLVVHHRKKNETAV